MASLEELRNERIKKLEFLREKGIDPYPATTNRTHTIAGLFSQFETLEKQKKEVTVAGRVMARRGQGALMFCDISDGTGKIQGLFKKDETPAESMNLFAETVDVADFVEISGTLFVSKRGERTVLVTKWRMLSKSLQPLPDKWYGLQDDELRYRQRHLDILMNPEIKDMFIKKAKFWHAARQFLINEGFIEVQTPTLELTTGGAEANPFVTHHNDYDMNVYLRISVGELWQKRLMAAGLPKTFEMGRIYRNEGSSPEHLQEFTNIEFYAAYTNFDEGLDLVERHFKYVLKEVFDNQQQWNLRGHEVDFSGTWDRIDYVETVQKMTDINVIEASEDEMKEKLQELGVDYEGGNKERLTDTLWKYCRKQIAGPVWLINHPKLVSPLSKSLPENRDKTIRAQLIIAGSELNNCYAELNDPLEQKKRFDLQQELIERGDDEAMMSDDEFVDMLETGMPPTFGASTVSERFFAFLMNTTIRETQLFPLMRPKE